MIRSLLALAVLAALAISTQAFVVPSIGQPYLLSTSTTSLDASRINAKQEKRKRNRENMRKFKKGGKRGTSKKKMMRKLQSGAARMVENEFIAKCFMTVPPPNSDGEKA
ncbi:hypothetical protein ACHAWU_008320 [Discostella pseudostelligera]|uniref:Uncharacterized protein n=1 Tax=Discostella pseudostelligera TaxID=259834 RepID=A0ABD3M3J0_9STRA